MGAQGEDDDAGDLSQEDMDDLGDLGEDEDDEDDNGSAGASGTYTPPSADEWAKIQRKIRRQEDRITALTGKDRRGRPAKKTAAGKSPDQRLLDQINDGEDDEPDEDDGEAARWRAIAIQNAASAQISAAGFSGTAKQAARLARLIDTTNIRPGRDGTFDLEDEIDELKDDYPQLFQADDGGSRRRVPAVRRADGTNNGRTGKRTDPTRSTSNAMLRAAGLK